MRWKSRLLEESKLARPLYTTALTSNRLPCIHCRCIGGCGLRWRELSGHMDVADAAELHPSNHQTEGESGFSKHQTFGKAVGRRLAYGERSKDRKSREAKWPWNLYPPGRWTIQVWLRRSCLLAYATQHSRYVSMSPPQPVSQSGSTNIAPQPLTVQGTSPAK